MNPRILGIIRSLGIPLGEYSDDGKFVKSDDGYKLPSDVSSLPDHEISGLLSNHSEWACFLSSREAEYEVRLIGLKRDLQNLEDYLMTSATQPTLRDKKAHIRCSEDYLALEQEVDVTEGVLKIIKSAIDNENRRYASLSRQITVRGQDVDRIGRMNNASYGPKFGKSVRR